MEEPEGEGRQRAPPSPSPSGLRRGPVAWPVPRKARLALRTCPWPPEACCPRVCRPWGPWLSAVSPPPCAPPSPAPAPDSPPVPSWGAGWFCRVLGTLGHPSLAAVLPGLWPRPPSSAALARPPRHNRSCPFRICCPCLKVQAHPCSSAPRPWALQPGLGSPRLPGLQPAAWPAPQALPRLAAAACHLPLSPFRPFPLFQTFPPPGSAPWPARAGCSSATLAPTSRPSLT